LFTAAIILFSLFLSCRSQTAWKMPLDEVRNRLKDSSYSFLHSVPFDEYPVDEALKLGPEAPYYLSLILRDLDREEISLQMLELLAKKGSAFWRAEGVNLLLETLVEKEQYQEAEEVASTYLKREADSRHRAQIRKMYIESLYWQHRDEGVLQHLKGLFTDEEIEENADLSLFRAVSSCRLDTPGWTSLFRTLFLVHPTSAIHIRAFGFLEQDPARLARFSSDFRALLEAKFLLAVGKNTEGAELLQKALSQIKPEQLRGSKVIRELGFGYLFAGTFVQGAKQMEELAARFSETERLDALEMAGRLYRKARYRQRSIELLKTVSTETTDSLQRDRSLWFALDMSLSMPVKEALKDIERTITLWNDPSYFDDLLDRFVTTLTLQKNDQILLELYQICRTEASAYITSRLYFILLRKNHRDLQPPHPRDLRRSAETANALVRTLYYERLISYLERQTPHALVEEKTVAKGSQNAEAEKGLDEPMHAFFMGFFDYGLHHRGYRVLEMALQREGDGVPLHSLFRGAARLEEAGSFTEGMRLMNYYLVKKETAPNREEWRLAYPKVFRSLIEEAAENEGVPDWLLFSVVREESYFDPVTGSRAGAVGLMQLMPDTAQDMARLLKMKEYDLKNPEHSLRLGTRYLARLYERFGNWPRTLMAYNAGPTRARHWERAYRQLPEDMVVEHIPLPETRHFVRKILVSAMMYTLLYDEERDPSEVIRLFYPQIP
jgi:hypothetical protein